MSGKMRSPSAMLMMMALAVSSPVSAEDPWMQAGTSETGTVIYVRRADVAVGRSHHTAARMWMKYDASRDRTVEWTSQVSLYVVNCVAETYRRISATTYAANGQVLANDERAMPMQHITPGSVVEAGTELVCMDPDEPEYDA